MFIHFLNSLKTPNNASLIEAIQKGFLALIESSDSNEPKEAVDQSKHPHNLEGNVETRNLSFNEFKRLTDENIKAFDLHQEFIEKNNGDLSGWKNRKFIGFFINKEFIGYITFYDGYIGKDENGQVNTLDSFEVGDRKDVLPVLYFSTFEIASDKRGGGIGTKLMDKFMNEHRNENIALRAHNNKLISYYNKFGFKLINKKAGNLMIKTK